MVVSKTRSRTEPVRLSFRDGEVIVTPKDQDTFFISAEKATEACRDAIRHDECIKRFTEGVILPLARWCDDHRDAISACYVTVPESAALLVYVVGKSELYDFALSQEISALAMSFDDRGWAIHASQLPRCDIEQLYAFFNPENALQIHG